jgi:glycogen debranching enzyme
MAADENENTDKLIVPADYVADNRLLCQGMPFVLTDAAHPRLILKHGGHFLALDQSAYMPACNTLGYGYYRHDTRHLSLWEIYLDDTPLSLLSSNVEKGFSGTFLYSNPQIGEVHQHKITVLRSLVMDEALWEDLLIENYSGEDLDIRLQLRYQADFADMFEVRGLNRAQRGQRMLPVSSADNRRLFLAYRGTDGLLMETIVEFRNRCPQTIADGVATFYLHLPSQGSLKIESCITTRIDGQEPVPVSVPLSTAQVQSEQKYQLWRGLGAHLQSNHELMNRSLERGFRDLYILRQPTPKGYGLAAGIPWYGAVFGRDSAITAWQMLPFHQQLARECIEVLAAYQGQQDNKQTEERPGKIMHELRQGELARTKIIPHRPYYGTVDATSLWLILLSDYLDWTGDMQWVQTLWPNIKLALKYLERSIDEGEGYLFYQREAPEGLENQGWKDSGDSIVHENGVLAQPPIAVCEAQSYLYAAYLKIARLAQRLEHKAVARNLLSQASELKDRFQRDFWMPEYDYLALALDGHRQQVKSISSNPGHCLFSGIISGDKAALVARRLMSDDLHSGWGIRTMASTAAAFNPISYHNGTVWPHDNAMIGEGMRAIGFTTEMQAILQGLVKAAEYYPGYRLPELFGGFAREESEQPIVYPVSCSPQSWSAGSIFQMLKACLNFLPDAASKTLRIIDPALPDWLGQIVVRDLHIGNATVDLAFHAQNGLTYCQILKKSGDVKIIIEN